MNRIATIGALALLATGCDELTKTDSGTDTSTGTCSTYTGPIEIQIATVTCTGPTTVVFAVDADGVPSDGLVFSQQTADVSTGSSQYSDEHSLAVVSSDDDCGEFSSLERTLTTDITDINDSRTDVNTLFSCAADTHYAADNVMTYAFRLYDFDGVLADCLIAGHNPTDVVAGTSDRINDPANAAELAGCAQGDITAAY